MRLLALTHISAATAAASCARRRARSSRRPSCRATSTRSRSRSPSAASPSSCAGPSADARERAARGRSPSSLGAASPSHPPATLPRAPLTRSREARKETMEADEKVVLDGDEMARALTRMAHEIVERNPGEPVAGARRDPPPRRVPRPAAARAGRGAAPTAVALGALDISFYRDDLAPRPRRARGARPHIDFGLDGADGRDRRRRPLHRAHRPRRDRGAVRVRPPRARPARGARRPRPSRAADPPRLRRQEPADLARRARQRARRELDGIDEVAIAAPSAVRGRRAMRHLLSIEDLDRADIERILAPPRASRTSPTARSRRSPRCAAAS